MDRQQIVAQVTDSMEGAPSAFAIRDARKVDARGIEEHAWIVADANGAIAARGTSDDDFEAACRANGIGTDAVIDASGKIMTPGYVDIHSHGAWEKSFDDGPDGIDVARAGHAMHGTTRQVCSLITNPIDVQCENLRNVRAKMDQRPDILGAHLEGPFLALSRKGAHDPECLKDPVPEIVDRMLEAADGCLRQITIAPELPHGLQAIRSFATAGTVPAVGHCDADYETARRAFDEGAGLMTHMFNAMNGLHHRKPGPIPAAVEDPRVTIELICDGFHVQDPMLRLGLGFAPHRIAFVTDAMAATDCPDGAYKLGALDVDVVDGHARLKSNGAIAGSTLTLEHAVQRAVLETGHVPGRGHRGSHADPGEGLRIRPAVSGHRRTPRSTRPRIRRRRAAHRPRRLVRPTRLVRGAANQVTPPIHKKAAPESTFLCGFSVATQLLHKHH